MADAPNFGPSGKIVYERTYSRTKPSGDRESWFETTDRVIKGNLGLVYGTPDSWEDSVKLEYDMLKELMDQFKILPAGRHLWASGVPGRQFLFNCHVSHWNEKITDHFDFSFMRLMEGGGVGSNYSTKYINRYPAPKRELKVHIVCDPEHPDYQKMQDAGVLSTEFSHEWAGAFQIGDSREGWSEAMCDLISTYFLDEVKHYDRVFNVTGVREEGRPLVSFGGTASGPLPLAVMLQEISEIINKRAAQQEKLTPIDLMEIDHSLSTCVVSGGNRRSARMSMVAWDDPYIFEFINCKKDSGKHWTTNISIVIDDEFNRLVSKVTREYEPKERLAKNVYQAAVEGMLTNGEPGFWNHSLSNHGEVAEVVCTNPCITSDTWIMTTEGARQVADLIGVPFTAIVDGKQYESISDGFFLTGHKPTVNLVTSEGYKLELTADHQVRTPSGWVEAGNLVAGDKIDISDNFGVNSWGGRGSMPEGYLLGQLIGDGTFYPDGKAACATWNNEGDDVSKAYIETAIRNLGVRSDFKGWHKTANQERIISAGLTNLAKSFDIIKGNKVVTPAVERASYNFYLGFLQGVFDTDGHVEGASTAGGISVRLTWNDKSSLEAIQRMLARLGVRSTIKDCHDAGRIVFGKYVSKASYRLIITGEQAQRFMQLVGFMNTAKTKKWIEATGSMARGFYFKPSVATVASIEPGKVKPVYDVNIADIHAFDANGIVAHNCGEITLREWEACILGHVNMDAFSGVHGSDFDFDGLVKAHQLMTRFLIRASFGDKADVKQQDMVNRNRRIGVGHLGVQGFLNKLGIKFSKAPHSGFYPGLLRQLYTAVRKEARDYSFQLRIPEPVKVTTVAPTGSIAKMPGVSEGIHPIYAKYFIRRIRFSTIDQPEKIKEFADQGYDVEPCVYSPNTMVVSFPTKEKLVEEVEALGFNADEIVESADEISIEDMLAFQEMYQTNYTDNAVSFTVNVPEGKYSTEEVMSILRGFLPKLKGTTIMVDGTRPQAPYSRISKMHYNYLSGPKSVEDSTDEDCSTGACPIR